MTYTYKTKPYDHQLEALRRSWEKKSYAFFMEMGTGKSKVLIDTIGALFSKGLIADVLILAPKGVYTNWTNKEIPAHLPDNINTSVLLWKNGQWTGKNNAGLRIHVMNIEALSTKKGFEAAKAVVWPRTLLAIDESTTIKNHSAKRTKAAIELGKMAGYRRILTGSPVTNSPLDLYGQCTFLDWRLLRYQSFYAFRNRYAVLETKYMGSRSFQVPTGEWKNMDELKEKLDHFSFQVKKKDCLDLPEKTYMVREVELTKEQKKAYQQMRDFMFVELDGQEVSAQIIITKLLRLHQICCGFLTTDTGEVQPIKSSRLDTLLQVLEECDKAIIWSPYVYNIEEIHRTLQSAYGLESCVAYYGATGALDRENAIQRFQDDPACRFFIGNPSTAGRGLTLTAASTVVYYGNTYNLEHRQQSEDRAHRIGQNRPVTYVDLVCPGTIDEVILDALRRKKTLASMVVGEGWKGVACFTS